MNKICIIIVCIVFWYPVLLSAQTLDENTEYFLVLPEIRFEGEDYEAAQIDFYPVTVSSIDNHTFLLRPINEWEYWMKSLDEQNIRGWICTMNPDGIVEISGAMMREEAYVMLELTGRFINEFAIKGLAVIRIGIAFEGESPFVYHSEWELTSLENREPLALSSQVTYHGPPMPLIEMTAPSPEERDQYPVNTAHGIKRFAGYEPHDRKYFYKGLPEESKTYYDVLLTELTWEEITYTPGILLLLDHLVTIDEKYRQKIAEGSVSDSSLHFFNPIPYKELQPLPPLYLILFVLDKVPQEDETGLQEVSPRFATMLEAYRTIPAEELADASISTFLITLSEHLPEEFRRSYYAQSPKLRNYVASSEDERLKALYPF